MLTRLHRSGNLVRYAGWAHLDSFQLDISSRGNGGAGGRLSPGLWAAVLATRCRIIREASSLIADDVLALAQYVKDASRYI